MSKLLKLKQWLSITEAADHLSSVFSEPVSEADVYRFALAGHLTLSVNLINHARGQLGHVREILEADLTVVPGINALGLVPKETVLTIPRDQGRDAVLAWAENHRELFLDGLLVLCVKGDRISETEVIDFESNVTTLSGVWDLPLRGGERIDIEQALQQELGGPSVELTNLNGAYVVHPVSGQYAKLLEHFGENNEYVDKSREYPYNDIRSYYPASGIPEDAAVVVRPQSLLIFVRSLEDEPNKDFGPTVEKELATRERNNLLRIIAGLVKESGISLEERGGGATAIEAAIATAGFEGPKEKAIRDVLAQVRKLRDG